RWIILRADVLVGRVLKYCSKCSGVAKWIAPFGPFRRCERQCLVEHGVEYVDKWNFGDQTGIEVWPHVGDRADQRSDGDIGDAATAKRPLAHLVRLMHW